MGEDSSYVFCNHDRRGLWWFRIVVDSAYPESIYKRLADGRRSVPICAEKRRSVIVYAFNIESDRTKECRPDRFSFWLLLDLWQLKFVSKFQVWYDLFVFFNKTIYLTWTSYTLESLLNNILDFFKIKIYTYK